MWGMQISCTFDIGKFVNLGKLWELLALSEICPRQNIKLKRFLPQSEKHKV